MSEPNTPNMDERISRILREQSQMESNRGTFENHWQEIAERVYPRAADFQGERTQGAKNTQLIFDATAALALERFAAAVESYICPRNEKWHGLETDDDDLNQDQEIQEYLEEVVNILFAVRYSPLANFASQVHENFMSLGSFGTGCMFVDEMVGRGIRYKAIHLSEVFFQENHEGVIDRVHRKFKMSARNIMEQFGMAGLNQDIPDVVKTAAKETPMRMFDVLHCVRPNDDIKGNENSYRGMRYSSVYMLQKERAILEEGGYRTFPYAVSRYVTQPRETYGRSPAMTVLPDIKMLNEMQKTIIRAAHMAVDPPLLLQEDGALSGFKMKPGALNFGGVDDQGRQIVHPLMSGAKFELGFEMQDQKRKQINDAFLVTLFQILVDTPAMTATEVMHRMREKADLLAPAMGRQQSELLGPMIGRELDILTQAKALPPMPQKMLQRGASIRIRYTGPMQQAQRASEGIGILRTLEAATPLIQIDPSLMNEVDTRETFRLLGEINGAPKKMFFTKEQMQAKDAAKFEAEQAAAMMEAAPIAGKAAKDLATAQAVAAQTPSNQFPTLTIE